MRRCHKECCFKRGAREEVLGVQVHKLLKMAGHFAQAFNKVYIFLGFINEQQYESRDVRLNLYKAPLKPQLGYCVRFWLLHYRRIWRRSRHDLREWLLRSGSLVTGINWREWDCFRWRREGWGDNDWGGGCFGKSEQWVAVPVGGGVEEWRTRGTVRRWSGRDYLRKIFIYTKLGWIKKALFVGRVIELYHTRTGLSIHHVHANHVGILGQPHLPAFEP